MQLTYFGHACFLLETSKARILFDPFINPNPLVQDIRSNSGDDALIGALDTSSISCDYVLISHGHEDHVADAQEILESTGATLVSNYEIVEWFKKRGHEKGHEMNLGGCREFDFGKVKYVNAVHSSVLPDGTYGGNPGGFVIEADEQCVYFAGDTALTYDMKLIGETYDIDWAILPIGDNFTMGVDDASRAAEFVHCKNVIGMHYDTFGYITIDHAAAKTTFEGRGQHLELMEIGQTKEL